MKKLLTNISVITLSFLMIALVAPSDANAKDMDGKYSLGYVTSEIPVGGRIWVTPMLGIDVGVGFSSHDLGDENATDLYFGGGLNYIIVETDRANFMLRGGATFGILDGRPRGYMTEETWTSVAITIMPMAEVFFGDHFSLTAGHGFGIFMESFPEDDAYGSLSGESRTDFRTLAGSIAQLGFHFYFN